jgi:HEPN domain-containing protein
MSKDSRNKAVEAWLSLSTNDLKSAKALYEIKLFDNCVYHLQQSNEKLLKALLLSIGIMTPKQARADLTVQKMLGFLPKEPRAYRHRTTRPLISDLEKSMPAIESYLTLIEKSELGPRVADFVEGFRASKKGLKELKHKIFGLIESTEQFEKEVNAAKTLLDNLDKATTVAKEKLDERARATLRLAFQST